jgi:DNA polymerase-3 subunit alpha
MINDLFLDIETTGKVPKEAIDRRKDFGLYPHIVSIAWDFKGKTKDFLVHQEGRAIPADATKVHGITTKMGNDPELTEPLSFVLDQLMCDAKEAANIIGHNIYFDTDIIKACAMRLWGVNHTKSKQMDEVLSKDKRICTMRGSMKLFKNKWPKLQELHKHLFGKEFANAHGAKPDMLAAKACYIELKRRKVI